MSVVRPAQVELAVVRVAGSQSIHAVRWSALGRAEVARAVELQHMPIEQQADSAMARAPRIVSKSLSACLALLLACSAGMASEPRRVPDTMAQRVLPCTSCHGKEGRATADGYFPRIAGKPAGYLHNQLINFRDGRRNYPLMVYLVERLTDDYLREMAQHFAALELPYPSPQPAKMSEQRMGQAETLVRQGNAGRKIPPCADCHGANLLGVNPSVPGLLGLSRFYLYAQLGHWKNGTRRAHAPDCMASIASRLTPEEIEVLSTWLAGEPVPPGAKPASHFGRPLQMSCGSIAE
jgi:cytochrome c553